MPVRTLATLFAWLLTIGPVVGQDPTEAAFLRKQAAELASFARLCFDQGYPLQARRIWQEILKDYDPDHAPSRAALGYRRLGTAWQEDDKFRFPIADNPDSRALAKVERQWDKTRRVVGLAHKAEAERFHAAGRSDRSQWHFARALRFLPDDAGVQAASGLKTFYGLTGSDLEQQLYERSAKLRDLVAREHDRPYEVRELPSTEQSRYLLKAGLPHAGYQTTNHRVWSNLEPGLVKRLAQNLERSRAFCAEVFTGHPGFHPAGGRCSAFIFLKTEDQYRKTLQANRDLFRKELLDFLLARTTTCDLGTGAERAKIVGDPFEDVMLDLSIRWPVDAWGGMQCDALNEGLGHAVVGRFLGRISVYSLDMERQAHTVTKRDPLRVLVPDLERWASLAIESAFRGRGAPLARMPLISAADFPTEARVRAWSFCDYLLRRDPRLLLELDATRVAKTLPDVRGRFQKATGIQVDGLEKEWRDFWTGATPVLQALRGNRAPFGASSKDAPKWLQQFDKLRAQYRIGSGAADALTWSAAWSVQCKQHAEYLLANRTLRGPDAEHTQEDGRPGATRDGQLFARMALVATKGSPASVMKDWIDLPGYRDALLDPGLTRVGVYARAGVAVFDVVRGRVSALPGTAGGDPRSAVYPRHGATGVPRELALARLGAELAAALQHLQPGARIGYPLTLHGWGGGTASACAVTANGEPVPGLFHRGGGNRRGSAPGMAVFFPARPLPRRAKVEVQWTLGNGRQRTVQFTTR